jgi:hypothetical protein
VQDATKHASVPRHPAEQPLPFGEEFLYELMAGPAGGRLRRPSSAGEPTCDNSRVNRRTSDQPRRDRGIRWAFLTTGLGGLL